MELIVRAFPILAGHEEEAKRVASDMHGAMAPQAAEFFARHGIVRETWHVQQHAEGSWIIAVTQFGEKPVEQAARDHAESVSPFDLWFKEQVLRITGIDPSLNPLGPPTECILDTERLG